MSDLIGSKLGIKEDPDGTPNPGSIGLSLAFRHALGLPMPRRGLA